MNVLKYLMSKFWRAHQRIVLKNKKYENSHKGETCLILSNGGSLKYFDITNSTASNYPVIACTYNLLDRRLQKLNVKYIAWPEPYSLYPLFYNDYPFVKKIQINMIRNIFKYMLSSSPKVQFFVNLTNCYSPVCCNKNVSYFHHFGNKRNVGHDLAGSFGESAGALDVMLGMAKYFGFSKAVLVGCDYLGSPPMMGHFYADSRPFEGSYMPDYCSRIKKVSEGIDVLVILPKGVTSPDFNYASYEDYFGVEKKYVENSEIVDEQCLKWLRNAAERDQAIMFQ